jgi:uncharacterized zinc-type alcohol dehydrogenase-like protein
MTEAAASIPVLCMAADSAACDFKAVKLQRRAPGANDVLIDMKFCGICHSDLHFAAGHMSIMGKIQRPCCTGHELAGVVKSVGASVTKFKVGDHIGVGYMVDSCGKCKACLAGEEQKCPKMVRTYNGPDKNGGAAVYPKGSLTLGGYTNIHVVNEKFGILLPNE